MITDYAGVIDGLSAILREEMSRLSREETQPSRDPDQSDDYIKSQRTKVSKLRAIREELEIIATKSTAV